MRLDMDSRAMDTSFEAGFIDCAFDDDDMLEGGWLEGTESTEVDDCCMCVMARDVADVVREIAFRAEDPTRESREVRRCDGSDDSGSDNDLFCGCFFDNPSSQQTLHKFRFAQPTYSSSASS
mmetsp:Transcript_38819/g.93385  ORF Transcript_38819/g.93385 Transcript_38819/m.93385 type:complete len:122 (-) Transcript_38819:81-446(-)